MCIWSYRKCINGCWADRLAVAVAAPAPPGGPLFTSPPLPPPTAPLPLLLLLSPVLLGVMVLLVLVLVLVLLLVLLPASALAPS